MGAAEEPERGDRGGAQRAGFPAVPARSSMPKWDVDLLDRQDEQGWGTKVIDRLSVDLRERFPQARGYSPRNLKYMRALAAAWDADSIVQAPLAQLPWYHHLALIEKLPAEPARRWYAAAAIEYGWNRDILVHHIETGFRERSGKAVTNFAATLPPADSDQAQQATRDPYLFDFLGTADVRRERDLKLRRYVVVEHVERFLLELGQGFLGQLGMSSLPSIEELEAEFANPQQEAA